MKSKLLTFGLCMFSVCIVGAIAFPRYRAYFLIAAFLILGTAWLTEMIGSNRACEFPVNKRITEFRQTFRGRIGGNRIALFDNSEMDRILWVRATPGIAKVDVIGFTDTAGSCVRCVSIELLKPLPPTNNSISIDGGFLIIADENALTVVTAEQFSKSIFRLFSGELDFPVVRIDEQLFAWVVVTGEGDGQYEVVTSNNTILIDFLDVPE